MNRELRRAALFPEVPGMTAEQVRDQGYWPQSSPFSVRTGEEPAPDPIWGVAAKP